MMTAVIWPLVRIGLGVYVGMCVLMFFNQARYVYYPEKIVGLTPAYMGLPFEDLRLGTDDGETLAAWYVPAAPATRSTVLFCHGNAGNIGHRLDSIRTFHKLGFNVLIFDYRGYGDSSGTTTEQGTYLDSKAAWDHLIAQRGLAESDIIVFGRSLGGAVAVWLAERTKPRALVVESAFTSATDMAALMFRYLPVKWFMRFKYDSLGRIGDLSCPVVVAHGRDDQTVPYEQGRRLFAAAPEPKRFFELQGGHNSGGMDANAAYKSGLLAFLAEHAPSSVSE